MAMAENPINPLKWPKYAPSPAEKCLRLYIQCPDLCGPRSLQEPSLAWKEQTYAKAILTASGEDWQG